MNKFLNNSNYVKSRFLVMLGVVICLFVSTFGVTDLQTAHATGGIVYYFSTSGDDSNDGLTISTPKQTLSAAKALAVDSGTGEGNILKFKRGDAWNIPFENFDLTGLSGTLLNPITIESYGTGPRPIISNLDLLSDEGWSNVEGTYKWKHAISGYSDAYRIYVNGVPKRKQSSSAAVNTVDEWSIGGSTVYVNTGSTTEAPTNVELHPIASVGHGLPILVLNDTHNIEISDIDFRGGSSWLAVEVQSPGSNISFDNIILQKVSQYGISVHNLVDTSPTSNKIEDISITNSLVDKVWADHMTVADTKEYGDGIRFMHAVDGGVIKDNRVTNFGHTAIALTAYDPNMVGVHNILIDRNDVSGGDAGYNHTLEVIGGSGKVTNNTIRRNYFHDYTNTNHIQGSNNDFYSNIFAGVTNTEIIPHSNQPYALDMVPWFSATMNDYLEAKNNRFINNTVTGTEWSSVYVGGSSNPANNVDENIFANNIFTSWGESYVGDVSMNVYKETEDLYLRNNNFWDGNGSTPVVKYKNTSYADNESASELNASCVQCSDNAQSDPLFENQKYRDLRLTAGSPLALREGGSSSDVTYYSSDFVDFLGNSGDTLNPSMGAIQYDGMALTNVASGLTATFGTKSGSYPGTVTSVSRLTDGTTATGSTTIGNAGYPNSYAQFDLGSFKDVSLFKIHLQGNSMPTIYRDVAIQLSTTSDFQDAVTVFNNDEDNSIGLGYGIDEEYIATSLGKTVLIAPKKARYVRLWVGGSVRYDDVVSSLSYIQEFEVFGTNPTP